MWSLSSPGNYEIMALIIRRYVMWACHRLYFDAHLIGSLLELNWLVLFFLTFRHCSIDMEILLKKSLQTSSVSCFKSLSFHRRFLVSILRSVNIEQSWHYNVVRVANCLEIRWTSTLFDINSFNSEKQAENVVRPNTHPSKSSNLIVIILPLKPCNYSCSNCRVLAPIT